MRNDVIDAINEIYIQESFNEINVCEKIAESYEKMDLLQECEIETDSFDILFQEGETFDAIKEDVKRQNEGKSTINKVFFTFFRLLVSIYNAITGKLKKQTVSTETTNNIKKNKKKRKSTDDSKRKGYILANVGAAAVISIISVTAGSQLFGKPKKGKNPGDTNDPEQVSIESPMLVCQPDGEIFVLMPHNLDELKNKLEAFAKAIEGKSPEDIKKDGLGKNEANELTKFIKQTNVDSATYSRNKVQLDDVPNKINNIKDICSKIAKTFEKTIEDMKKQGNTNDNKDDSADTNENSMVVSTAGKSISISLEYIESISDLINEFNSLSTIDTEEAEDKEIEEDSDTASESQGTQDDKDNSKTNADTGGADTSSKKEGQKSTESSNDLEADAEKHVKTVKELMDMYWNEDTNCWTVNKVQKTAETKYYNHESALIVINKKYAYPRIKDDGLITSAVGLSDCGFFAEEIPKATFLSADDKIIPTIIDGNGVFLTKCKIIRNNTD